MQEEQKKIIVSKIISSLSRFLPLTISIFVLLIVARVYEFMLVGSIHIMPGSTFTLFAESILNDLFFFFFLSGLIAIPFLVIDYFSQRASLIFFIVVQSLFFLSYFGLIQYFSVTFIPLGLDLFGYNWNDIVFSVKTSSGFGLLTLILLVIYLAVLIFPPLHLRKISTPQKVVAPFYIVVAFFLFLYPFVKPESSQFSKETEYYLISNKASYFWGKVFEYFTSPSIEYNATEDFPLLHNATYDDVLGPFFKISHQKPNLIFLLLEGLGRSFVGEGAEYSGFTPFLDSLTRQSLYWENFVCTSGRTFNIIPSIFGSLPYGEKGFMEMGVKMPDHLTLIKLLNNAGYFTSYHYGGNANFDLKDVFLERQNIDELIDENHFGPGYRRSPSTETGFSWGYTDGDLFKRSLEIIKTQKQSPRLTIYLTMNTHEPFLPPNAGYYWRIFEKTLERLQISSERKKEFRKYKLELSSLIYLDEVVHNFITSYQQLAEFKETIFFITADHRIIPIPPTNTIDRFHVPLIIYSPMLKKPVKFSSVSSHLDVTSTLIAFLHNNYGIEFPESVHWMGKGIDTTRSFRNIHSFPIMRNKNELIDYVDGEYYLAGEQLFKLLPGLIPIEMNDIQKLNEIKQKLADYKTLSTYVCSNNRIYPVSHIAAETELQAREDSLFATIDSLHLNSDQLFELARSKAYAKQYEEARLICRRMLRNNPNYHDLRFLLGLTYAWEGRYDEARNAYRYIMKRAPFYADVFRALADIEFWSGNSDSALVYIQKALELQPKNKEFLEAKNKYRSR